MLCFVSPGLLISEGCTGGQAWRTKRTAYYSASSKTVSTARIVFNWIRATMGLERLSQLQNGANGEERLTRIPV